MSQTTGDDLPVLGRVEHVAIWVQDLDLMRSFYTQALGGTSGELYENPSTGFKSYFVALGDGARLELMNKTGIAAEPIEPSLGFAHLALTLGSPQAVDALLDRLRQTGVRVESEPRTTGDGYYEAVILDPEGNRIELTA